MPWNNQGSGGAGKGPWGSGPATPDLEEFLRQCSASLPSSMRTMSAETQAAGQPMPENRPCAIT